MWTDVYVAEKLRELEDERLSRRPRLEVQRAKTRPILAKQPSSSGALCIGLAPVSSRGHTSRARATGMPLSMSLGL